MNFDKSHTNFQTSIIPYTMLSQIYTIARKRIMACIKVQFPLLTKVVSSSCGFFRARENELLVRTSEARNVQKIKIIIHA